MDVVSSMHACTWAGAHASRSASKSTPKAHKFVTVWLFDFLEKGEQKKYKKWNISLNGNKLKALAVAQKFHLNLTLSIFYACAPTLRALRVLRGRDHICHDNLHPLLLSCYFKFITSNKQIKHIYIYIIMCTNHIAQKEIENVITGTI